MIVDTVRAFLVREFFRGEAVEALALDQPLVSSGLLDSIATLKLVLFLEKQFDISIDSRDIVAGELETLNSMEGLVRHKTSAKSA
jgi:acyl carrier protein